MRLEDGDVIHEVLEAFAREKGIKAASVVILGGADVGFLSGGWAGAGQGDAHCPPDPDPG